MAIWPDDVALDDHFDAQSTVGFVRSKRRWEGAKLMMIALSALPPIASSEKYRYSITWSARASSDGGTSRSSAFAVFRLMTSSYFLRGLHWQIGRLLALEYAVNVGRCRPEQFNIIRTVGDQTTGCEDLRPVEWGGQTAKSLDETATSGLLPTADVSTEAAKASANISLVASRMSRKGPPLQASLWATSKLWLQSG
jgi:hypothetical protein